VNSYLERVGYGKVGFVFTVFLMLGIVVGRFYYTLVTGYILPDEAWYFNNFILDKAQNLYYREVFVGIFTWFFSDVKDIHTLIIRGAIYSAIWAVGCVAVAYAIFKRLEVSQGATALLLLSMPLFPTFTVLAPMILTETMGLFFALLGVYFIVSYLKSYRAGYALLSSVAFVMAYKVREPYLIFVAGNFITMLLAEKKPIRSILAYAVPMALVFPIPISIQPLAFAQPVYGFIISMWTQIFHYITYVPPSPPPANVTITAPPPSPTIVLPTGPELLRSSVVIPLQAQGAEFMSGFITSLVYGYNPLFAIFAFVAFLMWVRSAIRHRSTISAGVGWNMLLAFLSFAISLNIVVGTTPSALTAWTSAMVRTTHTSLPAIAGFSRLYEKVKTKHMAAILLVFLALASTQIPQLTDTLQRSLSREPVDRLSFDYRAPYYRLYLLAKDSGRTLVIGGLHMRAIRVYMSMLPNVVVLPVPGTEEGFKDYLSRGWDTIFLYDDYFTIKIPWMAEAYPPYYREILLSRTYQGYQIEMLWVDGESYAVRMTKSAVTSTPATHDIITWPAVYVEIADNLDFHLSHHNNLLPAK